VAAETPADVVAAVRFASAHRLRLVVKGTGHDYLGRSNAPDSLLVWTHNMRRITMHGAFVAAGCPLGGLGPPAVSIEAGARWLEAYQEVAGRNGRYVQGGGCTSVGAAGGFILGGGFGSWSKKFGTGAANLLEAEVVTADGRLLVANACQNQDLFWALRGGGGSTFGIVTRVTLLTHPLPAQFGAVLGKITAKDDGALTELLEELIRFYARSLNNEHWGEQVHVRKDSLELSMLFQGLSASDAEKVWQPLRAWIEARPERFTIAANVVEIPAARMWDPTFFDEHVPGAIKKDARPDAPKDRYYWATNQGEVGTFWYAYQSRWLPVELFDDKNAPRLARALFEASRHWPLELHFNKGLAGAAPDAVQRTRETATNPAVLRAAALVIVAATGDGHPGLPGHEPDVKEGEAQRARVSAAMAILRAITPGAGSYVNETDYFEPDWQQSFWGENYPRLLEIKRKYDPTGLFSCHHCVGSER
jgi:FAD/FMN-containing dehydrogenase